MVRYFKSKDFSPLILAVLGGVESLDSDFRLRFRAKIVLLLSGNKFFSLAYMSKLERKYKTND